MDGGSKWFERHPFLLAALLFIDAVHSVLKLPTWAPCGLLAQVPANATTF